MREGIDNEGFIQFGKHAGAHLTELPLSYLTWLSQEKWLSPELRAAVETQLGIDQPEEGHDPDPSPELASVAFPRLIWLWCEDMHYRFDGERDALAVVEAGFAKLRDLCVTLTRKPWSHTGGAV